MARQATETITRADHEELHGAGGSSSVPIAGLSAPSASSGAATKGYVDALAYAAGSVISAAGVPAGAPASGKLPLAYDSTAVTGGFYFWNGAAWVKVATIL